MRKMTLNLLAIGIVTGLILLAIGVIRGLISSWLDIPEHSKIAGLW